MAVVNQFTKSKDWQRLQTLDATIAKLRKQCRELYVERIELAGKLYGSCQSTKDHARTGTGTRGDR